MIHVFYKNRHTIGQLMVALMFLGTFGFLFTFDGFVSESGASSCCGGGEAAVISFAVDSSGDFGSDIPTDASDTDGCYGGQAKLIPSSSNNDGDPDCDCLFEPGSHQDRKCGSCADKSCDGSPQTSCSISGCDCNYPCCYAGQRCKVGLCEGKSCG